MIALRLNRVFGCCLAIGLALVGTKDLRADVLFDYNFSAIDGSLANVVGVDESSFLASSILGFRDLDGSGDISDDDTFQDYTMIRVTAFLDPGGDALQADAYGTHSDPARVRTHEITIKTAFHGKQISSNQYTVTGIDLFEVYFDSGLLFTRSNFSDLTTFQNGLLVESGDLGGPSGGNNSGPTAPDGTIDVVVRLFDLLHLTPVGQYFELDTATKAGLTTAGSIVLQGIFDANNVVTPPFQTIGGLNGGTTVGGNAISVGGGFADVFGVAFAGNDGGFAGGLTGTQNAAGNILTLADVNGAFSFGFQTRSDGSFSKRIAEVPEPSSLLVWSLIGSVGFVMNRRRKQAR